MSVRKSLTPKQEKFCQCIISGMTGKDSYITAYDTNAGDNTIYTEVTRLLDKEDIQKRLETLRKPLETQAKATAISERAKKRQFLWNVINDETQNMSDRLKATDLLNKMDSEYTNNTTLSVDNKTNISGLDTNTLKQLVSSEITQ